MVKKRTHGHDERGLRTLRRQYLAAAAFLIVFVFASALVAQGYIASVKAERASNIEVRNRVALHTRLLRYALLEISGALDAFMWSPSKKNREAVRDALAEGMARQQALVRLPWLREAGLSKSVGDLGHKLDALHQKLAQIMDMRTNKVKQFPAMRYLQEEANPAHRAFLAAARLAIEESATDGLADNDLRLQLTTVRSNWALMVADFRMYLANRVGALIGSSGYSEQQGDIELLYSEIQKKLNALSELDRRDQLSLEVSDSVARMQKAAKDWFLAYRKVKAIDSGAYWRADVPFLRATVEPAFRGLWKELQTVETAVENSATRDVQTSTAAANTLIRALWFLAAVGFAFIVAGFILFERVVLSPIATVAQALKGEAVGRHDVALPEVKTVETANLVAAFDEMRFQVQERQQALEHQALHDALTGLPNRTLLQQRVQEAIAASDAADPTFALLTMDLDGFKEINDSLGHQLGDILLRQLGERLAGILDASTTVARLGGDEFGILVDNAGLERTKQTVKTILEQFEQPFAIGDHNLYIGGSIGVALYPTHAQDAETLTRRADVAMYTAKERKTGFAVYDESQDRDSMRLLSLANDLREMIDEQHLQILYQPQIDLHTGALHGLEALLRWNHPTRGLISPVEFIPMAERTGLIHALTRWLVDTALAQCAHWQANGVEFNRLALNLSVYNLQDTTLVQQLQQSLRRWKLPPHCISLEITESAMMADPDRAQANLERLKRIGVEIAVDDFGTGFSSLAYLKRLPVDKLKIDKSFVMEMFEDENDAVIVRSTIDLAHNLGLAVVAEGVESQDVQEILQILECDAAQGYHISRPVDASALEAWYRKTVPQNAVRWGIAT